MTDSYPTPPSSASPESERDSSGPQSEPPWIRLLYMILFAAFSYGVLWVFLALSLLQFIVFIVGGKPNDELRGFSRRLLHFMGAVLAYLSFMSETKPFPFSPFPDGSPKS